MERARLPRSGIPTFVGSNCGRVHSRRHDKGDKSASKGDSVVYSSSTRKSNPGRHSSPRLQRHVYTVNNARSNRHPDRSQGSGSEYQSAFSTKPVNSDSGSYGSCQGYHHTPKHCPLTELQHVSYALMEPKDTNECPKDGPFEENYGGCESKVESTLRRANLGQTRDNEGQEVGHQRSVAIQNLSECSIIDKSILTPSTEAAVDENRRVTTTSVNSLGDSNPKSYIQQAVATAEGERWQEGDNVPAGIDSDVDNINFTVFNSNYPIRGTISPLTNKVAIKRSVGPVDEVSFVFGRPASPTNKQIIRCSSSKFQPYASMIRCMSPSGTSFRQGHHIPRPMSPSSDVLPFRREIVPGTYPPTLLGIGAATEARVHHQRGICCEHCNGCLVELKRQALRLMFPESAAGGYLAQSIKVDNIGERLTVPESYERWYSKTGQCGVCETPVQQLKEEAVVMILSIQLAQTTATTTNISALVGSYGLVPQQRNRYNEKGNASSHYSSELSSLAPSSSLSKPLAAQAQAYLDQNVRAYISPQKCSQMLAGPLHSTTHPVNQNTVHDTPETVSSTPEGSMMLPSSSSSSESPYHPHYPQQHHQWPGCIHPVSNISVLPIQHVPFRNNSSPSHSSSPNSPPPMPSAAVSFFARAAQKLGKKKKRHHSQDQEQLPPFPTNFADVIRLTPPPAPPCLLRAVGRMQNPGMGKVKVMLKICSPFGSQGEQGASFLSSDPRKKQVTVFDPSASGYVTSANRRTGTAAPKMFAFDSVFTPDESLTELCASSLAEIVQAVVAGADGCLFTYGYSKLGKTHTMIGADQSPGALGIMPCAIAWLFKLINEQKDKTGARFSVRVSAVQVTGKEEILRDLLSDIAQGTEATGVGTAPSVYLREDPICGTQLENQSELRAPTADKAAHYLDAALAARCATDEDEARSSHLLFTLNVYQYRIEKANTKAGLPGVAGGRSRLHLIDLGTASKSKDPNNVSLSLSALGNVIMALLNGQRHVPHRDSKIAQLLRDSLGNLSCRTCMIAHVSSAVPHYNETLQVIQLAARIHRMKRRRTRFSSTSSEDSSTDGDVKFRRPYRGLRMGTLREDVLYSSSHSDPDYTSSSEQSCDTVIYIGANGQSLSDKELTDNEGPPRHVPRTNPRLPRRPSGSRSSGEDSDSGRSVHSVQSLEPRSPGRVMLSPPHGGHITSVKSLPGSPNPGLVKISHRMGIHGITSNVDEGSTVVGHWQDKINRIHCHSSQSKLAKAIHDKQQPLAGEQWIDGPGASIYPVSKSDELWVDGPQAFVVQQQPQSVMPSTSSPGSESQHHHRGDSSSFSHYHKVESSSRRVASKKVDAEEQWVDGPREMLGDSNPSQPMHTCSKLEHSPKQLHQPKTVMSTGVNEKALKQALVKHILETKDKPESSVSIESDSSLKAEAVDSGPVSINSSDDQMKDSGPIKNIVESSHIASNVKQVEALITSKKQKPCEQKKPHPCKQSSKATPSASPSIVGKCSKEDASYGLGLQKSQLPSSASPTHRVVQWIKSVSSDQHASTKAGQESSEMGVKTNHNSNSSNNIEVADAETNTEHDSDFERMAEENCVKSDSDEGIEVQVSGMAWKCEQFAEAEGRCNTTLDISINSSLDNCVVNRGSVYELEVEERLEFFKNKVETETFSSLSFSNRDLEEIDIEYPRAECELLLVQHTKALTESKQASQLAKHLARNRCKQESWPSDLDYDHKASEASDPLLSRKPDGASNSNLPKMFFEEDQSNLTATLVETYTASSHDDSGINNPTISSKKCTAGLEEEVFLCDSDMYICSLSVQGEVSNAEYSASPKLGNKSKPPLPAKVPPILKQSGPLKQVPALQSLSRSIYCTAKPTPPYKETLLVQPKAASYGKLAGLPNASPGIRNKFSRNEKNGTSSLGISQGPLSSATSSPPVSTTSKSSSSSPALKANSKTQNGCTNKLPSFCSSRTASPSRKDNGKARKKEKEKDIKGISSVRTTKLSELVQRKGNDSDSGNDSGIVAREKRLLSPYATVTKPRTPSHSSSGHGSDNSTISTEVHPGHSRPGTKPENLHGGTSSGYESMLRDSEATGSSSGQEDSESESSSECKKGSKGKGTRRSRSAPEHSNESSPASSQPSQAGSRAAAPANRAWVDTRHLQKVKDEPLELKNYDTDEVKRLGRRRNEDAEPKVSSDCNTKNGDLKVEDSDIEISDTKDRIIVERNGWSLDCKFLMCFSCKSRQRETDV